MGRGCGRLTMEPIKRETDCKTTFQRRKMGLMKKAYEFTTLCGVDACIIIYRPNFDQPEIWPKDHQEVNRIIDKYKTKIVDRRSKCYALQDYFKDKRSKIEAKISKVQKEILKILYPTWNDSFDALEVEELKMFVSMLDAKINSCNQRINMLKKGKEAAPEVAFEPYLFSNPLNQLNFQGQVISPASMKPIIDNNMLAYYPFQLYKNFQTQMCPIDKAAAIDYDSQIGVLNDRELKNNQNSSLGYYNENVQIMQPYRHDSSALQTTLPSQNMGLNAALETLSSLPNDFQTYGYYNILQDQDQMFNYMHRKK